MKALAQRKSLSSTAFDARSVMLFAALSLGGIGALQAQTSSSTSPNFPPRFGPAAQSTPQSMSSPAAATPAVAPSIGPSTAPVTTSTAASAAFDRADTNKDGQLSPQEAAQLPAIGQRFKELDTDQSGSLSRAEFEKGAQS